MTLTRALPLALLAAASLRCGSIRAAQPAAADRLPLSSVKLPPGFRIAVYADVPGARSLTLGDQGTVFVGTPDGSLLVSDDSAGAVYRISHGT